MTAIEARLQEDLKQALKAGDKVRASTIRQLRAQLQYARMEAGDAWAEDRALAVIAKVAKMHRESIAQFEQGNRSDLAEKERAELRIVEEYLPHPLTEEELDTLIEQTIAEVGASGPRDVGNVMRALMPKVRGRADGKAVNARVRQKLGAN